VSVFLVAEFNGNGRRRLETRPANNLYVLIQRRRRSARSLTLQQDGRRGRDGRRDSIVRPVTDALGGLDEESDRTFDNVLTTAGQAETGRCSERVLDGARCGSFN